MVNTVTGQGAIPSGETDRAVHQGSPPLPAKRIYPQLPECATLFFRKAPVTHIW